MDPNIIIAELDRYSRISGLKQTTICQNALGNARLYERLKRRAERMEVEAAALRAWMENNPPTSTPDESAA
ncbi:hypothetical protein QCN27_03805 [Cereibacter sp. SYSU M97828]|nr:hypothetical protein [Cereibacter flavus]